MSTTHITILLEGFNYNHPASAVSYEVRSFEDKVRSRAVNTNESTQDVIDNCLKNVSDQMVVRLPNIKHIQRNIQRQRQRNGFPQISHNKNSTQFQQN
ncbi:unnamed protein product [Didymodactylos carnosus]|uniref:Uncharacterized protein n=1 Tax=Didymodactylos carnosus TaxID=1234261 RepID=A0A8S2DWK4_9BILA|nr:unnamed protein product [Didymodactylos carnosus]CAF3790258.1 unnamed protein product [Didymodactylos carnosus]